VSSARTIIAGLSASALIGIALHEGYRDKAYDDGVGVQTIGFGTTDGVKPGDRITVERALVRLGADVARHEAELRRCVQVPVYQYEWDAYVSWAYNVGTGAACKSTLVKKLNAGDYPGACKELLRWTRAGGRELPGLVKRRRDEYRRCIGE
jgi:lysozyme